MSERHSTPEGVYLGIDYHSDFLQVCALDPQGTILFNRRCPNSAPQLADLAGRLPVRKVAIEVGTGAANFTEDLVDLTGWIVELAHPGYVARMKRGPDKHDWADSRLLADLTRVGYLPKVWLASESIRELRRLVRYRQQHVNGRRNAKLRVRALLRDHRLKAPTGCTGWSLAWKVWVIQDAAGQMPKVSQWILHQQLAMLEFHCSQIRKTEKRLRAYTRNDPLTQRLKEEAGVGEITAWVMRAEIGRFDRFNRGKTLSRFCGLSPKNASSGKRQADAGVVKAGAKLLRSTLIELAHRLARTEERWHDMKQHLVARGKPGSVAATAIANRWVRGLYHRIRNWQEERVREGCAAAVGSALRWA